MASSSYILLRLILILLLLSTLSSTVKSSLAAENTKKNDELIIVEIDGIFSALSRKNYNAMAVALETTLRSLIPYSSNTTSSTPSSSYTIFCPLDAAFMHPYKQPPFTLLMYHVTPSKLSRELIVSSSSSSSSLPLGSKIDTLLPHHPLVVTTPSGSYDYSFNNVRITHFEIYNDGFITIHGVEGFFDPAFVLREDGGGDGTNNKGNTSPSASVATNNDSVEKGMHVYGATIYRIFSWLGNNLNLVLLVLLVLSAVVVLVVVVIRCSNYFYPRRDVFDMYSHTETKVYVV